MFSQFKQVLPCHQFPSPSFMFSFMNFASQMVITWRKCAFSSKSFLLKNTSVRSVLISYHRILSTRRAINNSCHCLFVVRPWTAQSWEADSCVRTSAKDLTWQVTNKFLSVHRERRQWPKVQREILKQNKTASFFLPKCLLWAYFQPTIPGHFIGLPSPLYSSHSLGHLRLATDQYEQFLEKYDVSMTTKPQILSGRQWDQ